MPRQPERQSAPGWDHRPFRESNHGVGDGIWVAPLDCGAPSAGRLVIPGGRFPD
jgi:hypothetical protein